MYNFTEQITSRQKDTSNSKIIKKTLTFFNSVEKYLKSQKQWKIENYRPILNLKRIIKLPETLRYQFQVVAYSNGINQNYLLQKNKLQ